MNLIGRNTLNPCALSGESSSPSNDTQARGSTRAEQGRARLTAASSEAVGENPGQPAPLAPIPDCPGYFIQPDGTVISFRRRKFAKNQPHEVKSFNGYVILCVGGRKVKKGIRGLMREAFGGAA